MFSLFYNSDVTRGGSYVCSAYLNVCKYEKNVGMCIHSIKISIKYISNIPNNEVNLFISKWRTYEL